IRNCIISNFSEGIRFSGATDGLIQNNTITNTFNGGNAIRIISSAHRNRLISNTIFTGNSSGIYIDGGSNNTVDCNGSIMLGGNFSGTYGIYTNQQNTTIRNCNVSNFGAAVRAVYAHGLRISDSNFSCTKTYYMTDGTTLSIADTNNVSIDNVYSYTQFVTSLYARGNNFSVSNSTFVSNGSFALEVYSTSNSVFRNNKFIGKESAARFIVGTSNFTVFDNNTFYQYPTPYSAFIVWNAQASYINFTNNFFNSTDSTVFGFYGTASLTNSNFINNTIEAYGGVYGIFLNSNSHNNSLIGNRIFVKNGHGIYTEGANTFIDCQGKTMIGGNFSNTYGVYSNRSNTSLRNCTIMNFAVGAMLDVGASNSTLSYNNISNNTNTGVFANSSGFVLTDNSFCHNLLDVKATGFGSGTRNRCDSYSGWQEEGHFGCTFACTSLWHRFFGNVSGQIIVGSADTTPYVYSWKSEALNIYVTDYDSAVNWSALQAIGKNVTNGTVSGDFIELDLAFGTMNFPDNITKVYSIDGSIPIETDTINVFGKTIASVPVANSTKYNTSFKTGILWDTSQGGPRYNSSLKQTTVWVVKANSSVQDAYGTYDFLIQVPYTLGMYNGTNNLIAIYAELK
ncbi:MAG: right-handed parallel beta-helix repeat-containing protein, partial [Candidatus Micrarchaeota archaeon]|nr:right-handed parallel beta-helix repeat-containing protein [Candidatus Micrarchaeota archaeon]